MTNRSIRILVVDDDELARMEVSRCVEQQGYGVSLAEDGTQALDMLRCELFDLVLLDLLMPGVDGFDVLGRIKEDTTLREIPVIVITAVDDPESAAKCAALGVTDHFTKPIDPVLLAQRINTILTKET
jgi:sigma-B regulation protein RsbU (phosphoserine phosphatase)